LNQEKQDIWRISGIARNHPGHPFSSRPSGFKRGKIHYEMQWFVDAWHLPWHRGPLPLWSICIAGVPKPGSFWRHGRAFPERWTWFANVRGAISVMWFELFRPAKRKKD